MIDVGTKLRTLADARAALEVLVGRPLRSLSREGTQLVLVIRTDDSAGSKERTDEVSLAVDMPWRLRRGHALVTGFADIWSLPDGELRPAEVEVPNRFDARLFEWAARSLPSTITALTLDPLGGFQLALENGHFFESFPDDTVDSPHWSLSRAGQDDPSLEWVAPASAPVPP